MRHTEILVIKILWLNPEQVKGAGQTADGKRGVFPHGTRHGGSPIQKETSTGSSAYVQQSLLGMMHFKSRVFLFYRLQHASC